MDLTLLFVLLKSERKRMLFANCHLTFGISGRDGWHTVLESSRAWTKIALTAFQENLQSRWYSDSSR